MEKFREMELDKKNNNLRLLRDMFAFFLEYAKAIKVRRLFF